MVRVEDFDPSVALPRGLTASAIRKAVEYIERELTDLIDIYHEQANVFIVEARVENAEGWLRPGMEAAAKIRVGRHNITYVWTRKLADWVRMKLLF